MKPSNIAIYTFGTFMDATTSKTIERSRTHELNLKEACFLHNVGGRNELNELLYLKIFTS